ncbi:MAG TPA: phage holin family protein [Oculatellaceae cyanobacterium]|jgi:uncharacterized membrane protein YqjE
MGASPAYGTSAADDTLGQIGLPGLFRELFVRVADLIKAQIELTKVEVKVEGRKLMMAGVMGLIALMVGSIFLMLLALSLLVVLAEYLQFVWAVIITTVVFLALTALFGWLAIWEIKRNSAYIDV